MMATVSNEQPMLGAKASLSDPWGVDWAGVRLSESFEVVCALNPHLRIEQLPNGEIVFMSPTGGETSGRNAQIVTELMIWTRRFGGRCFDSSVIFQLPNGSKRSPDASWIAADRWIALSKEDRKKFPPLCPDFVIELRSETDRLLTLEEKMESWIANGARLGWLIDPLLKRVHIYRPERPAEILDAPASVSGENVLPGFVLEL